MNEAIGDTTSPAGLRPVPAPTPVTDAGGERRLVELAGELPSGERISLTGFANASGALPSGVELDARLQQDLARGPVTAPIGDAGSLVLAERRDGFHARLQTPDGQSVPLHAAEVVPGELHFGAPAQGAGHAGMLAPLTDWLVPRADNEHPYRLEDANGNGMVDGPDRRNGYEEPVDPRELARRIPDEARFVVFGENHAYTEPVRDMIQAFVEHNRDVHGKETIVIKELPYESFNDAIEQLNDMRLREYGDPLDAYQREAFRRAWQEAIRHWLDARRDAMNIGERLADTLSDKGPVVASMRADGEQLLDLRAAGARIYAGASYEQATDRSLDQSVQLANVDHPDAVIVVQTGLLHAQTEASDVGSADNVDRDEPLGKRLEARYGEDDVHSMLFQPLGPPSYKVPPVPFDHFDQVVPTTRR